MLWNEEGPSIFYTFLLLLFLAFLWCVQYGETVSTRHVNKVDDDVYPND